MNWIPGHVRAYTAMLCPLFGIIAYSTTGSWAKTALAAILPLAIFLGDQATHLAQMEHRAAPLTWTERQQQRHRWPFVFAGIIAACALLYFLL